MSDKYTWRVYATPKSPAATATMDRLRALGIEFEERPLSHARNVMRVRGFKLTPVVVVWVENRHGKGVQFAWEGHQPSKIEAALDTLTLTTRPAVNA